MTHAFFNLGLALSRLEKAGAVTAKKFLWKHHPSNTGDGFLYRKDAVLRVANDLTEMAVAGEVEGVLSMLPLLTAKDLETFSAQGFEETFSFFEGLYTERGPSAAEMGRRGGAIGGRATTEAKRATAAENGKKGGRPKKNAA